MSRGPAAINALIAINKPAGMTSHDVVSRVRRAVGEKRVGHAGTLDPAATGVLVVGIGQATKLLGLLTLDRKKYRATFQLGAETTTDDAEGEVVRTAEVPDSFFDEAAGGPAMLAREVRALIGEQDQVPPAYSAVSVGGKRAYAMARAGEQVELKPRRVTVHGASLTSLSPYWKTVGVELEVSKGTYVRSIARDLGRKLGCYAHVSELERVSAGPVTLDLCADLEELQERGIELVHEKCLDPVWALGLPVRSLDAAEVRDVMNGRPLELGIVHEGLAHRPTKPCERVALVWGDGLVGVWARQGARLVCESNFPQAIEGVCSYCDLASLGPSVPLAPRTARRLVLDSHGNAEAWRGWSNDFELMGGLVRVELSACDRVDPSFVGPDALAKAKAVVAVGAFDGFHRGHQALIARARAEAEDRGAVLLAVAFDPDPAYVLGDPDAANDLMHPRERATALLNAGVDGVVVVRFTREVAAIDYTCFVREALCALVDLSCICVGSDFCFGARGAGTAGALEALGREDGFDVVGMELAGEDGSPITATRIRGLLRDGKVDEAAVLLGRCHRLQGTVVHGRGEGTSFGFPTANVEVAFPHALLPAEGVYAGFVVVHGTAFDGSRSLHEYVYPAAVNVGYPRSFEGAGASGHARGFLEATLLGFEGDLYGRYVTVVFVRWLREPRVFGSLEELESTVLSNVDWVRRTLGDKPIEL